MSKASTKESVDLPNSGGSKSVGPPSRHAEKSARRFLKDVRKLVRKNDRRISDDDRRAIADRMAQVAVALERGDDAGALADAVQALDERADQALGAYKKSALREYSESVVIAVLIAMVLRAFVVEPFKIPTGSMIPTLAVGDHIFVSKFIYGLRVPLTNSWFAQWGTPERGHVIVFRYPLDLSKDYIKRVVAVAGDRIRIEGREVYVNGSKLARAAPTEFAYTKEDEDGRPPPGGIQHALAFAETSRDSNQEYTVIYHPYERAPSPLELGAGLKGLDCAPIEDGSPECTVSDGWLFVMGDNRDNSADSRVWGGVPTEFVKGRALFIWWSRGSRSGIHWDRIGKAVQ